MLVAMRVSMSDRPGMLGQLTTLLGEQGCDITGIEVVERCDGVVVDDLVLEAPAELVSELHRVAEEVPGLVAESVRALNRIPSPAAPLELAVTVATTGDDPVSVLAAGLPAALQLAWALVVRGEPGGCTVLAASPGAPRPGLARLPWLPLDRSRRLPTSGWMPASWRMRAAIGGLELAAAPFGDGTAAVLAARHSGLRFRPPELRQLELLAGLAADRSGARVMGPVAALLGAG